MHVLISTYIVVLDEDKYINNLQVLPNAYISLVQEKMSKDEEQDYHIRR